MVMLKCVSWQSLSCSFCPAAIHLPDVKDGGKVFKGMCLPLSDDIFAADCKNAADKLDEDDDIVQKKKSDNHDEDSDDDCTSVENEDTCQILICGFVNFKVKGKAIQEMIEHITAKRDDGCTDDEGQTDGVYKESSQMENRIKLENGDTAK